jgi:probable phosphoglycerate mutase
VIGLLFGGCGAKATPEPPSPVVQGNVVLHIYIVRHGEAYRNIPHPPDTPEEKLDSLTPKGLQQAAAAGSFLKDKGVVAVITSPTGRTQQTADAIGQALGLTRRYLQDKGFAPLREGTTPEGKPVSWSWRQEQWKAGHDPRPAGGESLEDGTARAVNAIHQLTHKYPGDTIAIVSHGEICATLLGQAAKTPICDRYQLHEVPTGSVSEIVITDAGWQLVRKGIVPAPEK